MRHRRPGRDPGPTGIALGATIAELSKWGKRFLFPPRPEDKLDPEWFRWFLSASPKVASPPNVRIELRMTYAGKESSIHIEAGEHLTKVSDEGGRADVVVTGESMIVAGIASGYLDPKQSADGGLVTIDGEASVLARFAEYFDFGLPLPNSTEIPLDSGGD